MTSPNSVSNGPEIQQVSILIKQLINIEVYKILQLEKFKHSTNIEKILLLDQLGFDVNDISVYVGTTPNTVRKELSVNKTKRVWKKWQEQTPE